MFSNPFCCISVFEAFFLHTKGLKIKYSLILEKCLLLRVFNSKRVQLVKKKNFSYLINIFWINVLNQIFTAGQILFQIGCSVEKRVAIRAKKGLEHSTDVAHVAYMIIVPQQSDSIPVFLHIPPSEFTYNFSIHNVYSIKKCSGAEGPHQVEYCSNGLLETKEG